MRGGGGEGRHGKGRVIMEDRQGAYKQCRKITPTSKRIVTIRHTRLFFLLKIPTDITFSFKIYTHPRSQSFIFLLDYP